MKTVNLKSLIEIYEKNGSKNLPLYLVVFTILL